MNGEEKEKEQQNNVLFCSIGVSPKSALFPGRIFGNTTQMFTLQQRAKLIRSERSFGCEKWTQ
jgi:hypothetical protein